MKNFFVEIENRGLNTGYKGLVLVSEISHLYYRDEERGWYFCLGLKNGKRFEQHFTTKEACIERYQFVVGQVEGYYRGLKNVE